MAGRTEPRPATVKAVVVPTAHGFIECHVTGSPDDLAVSVHRTIITAEGLQKARVIPSHEVPAVIEALRIAHQWCVTHFASDEE